MPVTTVERFKALLPIDNPSGKEDRIREHIMSQLSAMGFNDAEVDAAGNLLVRIPGDERKETFLFSAHMDSVPPCLGIEAVEETYENRRIIRTTGRTILGADDKSGIATMISLAERLKQEGDGSNHPMEFLFSTQEEVGLLGLKAFDLTRCRSTMGFVLDGEGSVGDVFFAGPTQMNLLFEFEGLRSHAGIAPDAGTSAIEMATTLCARLPIGRISPELTLNIGTIEGGDAFNIVAPSAVMRGEARSHNPALLASLMQQVEAEIQGVETRYPKGKVSFTPTQKYQGYAVPDSHPVTQLACLAAEQIGLTPVVKRMNIGSDAHVLNHGGIPCVVLGMGFHYSHSLGEYIFVDELEQVSDWVWQIIHR